MIALPAKPDKPDRMSFLISFGILLTLAISLTAWLLTGLILPAVIAGIAVTAGLATTEWIRPRLHSPLYSVWNRAAHIYAGILHGWVSRLCFYLVFTLSGRFGKHDAFKPHRIGKSQETGGSTWSSKQTLEKQTYSSQSDKKTRRKDQNHSWTGNFIHSNAVSRNKWLVFLLPHLVLLRISSVKKEQKKQEDIYTLY